MTIVIDVTIRAWPIAVDGDWSGVVSPFERLDHPRARSYSVHVRIGKNERRIKFESRRDAESVADYLRGIPRRGPDQPSVPGALFTTYITGYQNAQATMREALGIEEDEQ